MDAIAEEARSVQVQALRILVVDDHDLVRQGLRYMLEARPGWTICGEATTGQEAIDLTQQLFPDVAVVDIHMPGMDGIEATRRILTISPQTEVLILTLDEAQEVMLAATAAGARGIVMKSDAADCLVDAVSALARHEPYYTSKASQILVHSLVHPLGASPDESVGLTKRERGIAILVADGHGNKQIATTLGISAKTVETHRRNIMRKLGLKSAAELVRYAVRNHLVQP
jgi:DNA-binding NarL/FixJ family response regulator